MHNNRLILGVRVWLFWGLAQLVELPEPSIGIRCISIKLLWLWNLYIHQCVTIYVTDGHYDPLSMQRQVVNSNWDAYAYYA